MHKTCIKGWISFGYSGLFITFCNQNGIKVGSINISHSKNEKRYN